MAKQKSKRIFRLAGVQFCGKFGKWEDNLVRMTKWVKRAAARGADLVFFPETGYTGFGSTPQDVVDTAQTIPGPAVDAIQALAREHDIAVSAGLSEKRGKEYYLSQATVTPGGRIHVYSKRLGGERGYSWGGPVPPLEYRGLKIGVVICMDARTFELYREYAYEGTNLLIKPNCAWCGPWVRKGSARSVERARAHARTLRLDWEKDAHFASANGMAMMAANAVGNTSVHHMPGGAWFCDGVSPDINKCLRLSSDKKNLRERMLLGDIDIAAIKAHQASHGVQGDLRGAETFYAARPLAPNRAASPLRG